MLHSINDRWTSGNLEKGECSVRDMTGKDKPGNRGHLDTALYKLMIKDNLINELMTMPITPASKDSISEVLASHSAYRRAYSYPTTPEARKASKAWIGILEPCAQKFLKCAVEVVYGSTHDGSIKLSLKASKSAKEALADGTVAIAMKAWRDLLPKEDEATSAPIGDNNAASSAVAEFNVARGAEDNNTGGDPKVMMAIGKLGDAGKLQLKTFEDEVTQKVDVGLELITELRQ
jgi:hypothetical protein